MNKLENEYLKKAKEIKERCIESHVDNIKEFIERYSYACGLNIKIDSKDIKIEVPSLDILLRDDKINKILS